MARHIANVDKTVLVRDCCVCTAGLQIFGDGFCAFGGCGVVCNDGVCDGEIESEVFNVAGVGLELVQTLVELFIEIAEVVEGWAVAGFVGCGAGATSQGPLAQEEGCEIDIYKDAFVQTLSDDSTKKLVAVE